MPNFRTHLGINLIVLGGFEALRQLKEMDETPGQGFDWPRALVNVGAGTLVGALPDWLEPSLGNPNHRGFCHSLGAGVLVWWLAAGGHTRNLPVEVRRLLTAIGIGYSAHLAADLFLSKGKGMGFVCPKF